MNNTQAITLRPSGAVGDALSVADVLQQVSLIQEVMHQTMREGEHYGKIPGCGDKPSLLQPGAQKLLLTFRMCPDYEVETIDLANSHREYRVKCRLTNSSGAFIGAGVGSCSTMEGKFRFRVAPKKVTDRPVPSGYWELRKNDPAGAQRLLGGPGFSTKKNDAGQWMIAEGTSEKVEHDNPADYYNTCLKMAKKRALVDATLTRTAASDIFTQDIEDIQENLKAAEVPQDAKPATVVAPGDWRGVRLHFGKNKDKALGELDVQTLSWYQNKWEPKEYPEGSGKFSEKDKALRVALDASMEKPAEAPAPAKEEDQVPF